MLSNPLFQWKIVVIEFNIHTVTQNPFTKKRKTSPLDLVPEFSYPLIELNRHKLD